MRSAVATRLATCRVLELFRFPPVIRLPGHKPNQETKCLAEGNRDGSKPSSDSSVSTVNTPKPSIRVKSTPSHAVQMGSQVKAGRIAGLLFTSSFGGEQWRLFDINLVCKLA
jgi:hypothetical protein